MQARARYHDCRHRDAQRAAELKESSRSRTHCCIGLAVASIYVKPESTSPSTSLSSAYAVDSIRPATEISIEAKPREANNLSGSVANVTRGRLHPLGIVLLPTVNIPTL